MTEPCKFRWDGEVMVPLPGQQRLCDQQYVVGEIYQMEVIAERNMRYHRAYFAEINQAYANLPEKLNGVFKNPDHLRAWCLIKTGHCKVYKFPVKTKTELMEYVGLIMRLTDYPEIKTFGRVMRAYVPHSQSVRKMSKEDFDKSSRDVLDFIVSLLGTTREELATNAEMVA